MLARGYDIIKGSLLFLLLCFAVPVSLQASEFNAEFIQDYGFASLIRVAGNYDADESVSGSHPARQKITKAFYDVHKDTYDFIVIFTDFDFVMPADFTAFYSPVKNDIEGIGLPLFDDSSSYGSWGALQGVVDMGNIAKINTDPTSSGFTDTMTTLSHELLHRWAAYITYMDEEGAPSKRLLGKEEKHWSFLLDSQGSVLLGNAWQDNGDGTFTTLPSRKYYSDLDLYLMGIVPASEVEPILLIEHPHIDPATLPQEGLTIEGSASYVTIEQIIAAVGERKPSSAEGQKHFKIGYVLASRSDQMSALTLNSLETIIRNWEVWFSSLTRGRAMVQTDWSPPSDIVGRDPVDDYVDRYYTFNPNISYACTWLSNHQEEDGSWMDSPYTAVRDTHLVLRAFALMGHKGKSYNKGLTWMAREEPKNTEDLAQKIITLAVGGQAVERWITDLAQRQNLDGGWGADWNYGSNVLDTAGAVAALLETDHLEAGRIKAALDYLLRHQNSDGGWGDLVVGSDILTTARILDVVKRFDSDSRVNSAISKGVDYVDSQRNSGFVFGEELESAYATAYVVKGLSGVDAYRKKNLNSFKHLRKTQLKDGSWQHSAFQTALSVIALEAGGKMPDLCVRPGFFYIQPNPMTVFPGEATLKATIINDGKADATGVHVVVYQEHIDPADQLHETVIDLAAGAVHRIELPVRITDINISQYWIIIDPADTILELYEYNNAGKALIEIAVERYQGDEGDNALVGDDHDNILDGGAGNDTLTGGLGDDTYHYGLGYGDDTILFDRGGVDTVIIAKIQSVDELQFRRVNNDLIITLLATGETLTIESYFYRYASGYQVIDEIRLEDGTVLFPHQFIATEGDDRIDGTEADDTLDGRGGDDTIRGWEGNDTLFGQDGNDNLGGGDGDDLLWGGKGDDRLYGNDGDDDLNGGPGNDKLTGGDGNNTYRFDAGGGRDTIYDSGRQNDSILILGQGLTGDALTFTRDDNALIIDAAGGDDTVIIEGYFGSSLIEEIILGDGNILTIDDIAPLTLKPTESDDELLGYDGSDTILGLGGDDTISGNGGDDALTGGPGNDRLNGGPGIDVYYYGPGDGEDIISSHGGGFDVISFLAGIHPEDVMPERFYNYPYDGDSPGYCGALDLILNLGNGNQIRIESYFSNTGNPINEIQFADGTRWDYSAIIKRIIDPTTDGDDLLDGVGADDVLYGGPGDDELYGWCGDDILDGGAGDDRLFGGRGDNVYYFGPGYGSDIIDNDNSTRLNGSWEHSRTESMIVFKEGITPENLFARRLGDDLLLSLKESEDALKVKNHFALATNGKGRLSTHIEEFHFHDGTVWKSSQMDALCLTATDGDDLLTAMEYDDVVDGLSGNDILIGMNGNDILTGGPGDDALHGNKHDDVLKGGPGNDWLEGGSDNDILYGDAGDDTLTGGDDNDVFYYAAGFGNDTITDMHASDNNMDTIIISGVPSSQYITIKRFENDLHITLKASGERLLVKDYFLLQSLPEYPGQVGKISFVNEEICLDDIRTMLVSGDAATAGDDRLFGDENDNVIEGLEGADVIYGDGGNDTLSGGEGDDQLDGGIGNDDIDGGSGNDTLIGGEGKDTLNGDNGDDSLIGGPGNDILNGGDGDDSLIGGLGNNILNGGDGNDNLIGGDWGDELYGDAGDDHLEGNGSNDELYGGSGNDWLDGGDQQDILEGGPGDDILQGGKGEDVLIGGDGDDILWSGRQDEMNYQNNRLIGNRGDDILHGDKGRDFYIFNPGDGKDRIIEFYTIDYEGDLREGDQIHFGKGITPEDLIITRNGRDLVIDFTFSETDRITIERWFVDPEGLEVTNPIGSFQENCKIENIVFDSGEQWWTSRIESEIVEGDPDGDDSGGDDSGGDDSGGNDTGGDDIGGDDTGGDDTGGNDTGGDDIDGDDTGEDDTGGNDTGGDDTGGNDTGGDDIGGDDSGGNDTGGDDIGGDDTGGDDIGGDDTGGDDSGGDDSGGDDSGGDDSGGDDSGGDDSGNENFDEIDPEHRTFDLIRTGTDRNNLLYGTWKDDLMRGEAGDDWLIGRGGDDGLVGGAGSDYLKGGTGDDVLCGQAGSDILNGGLGDDVYLFSPGDGADIIHNEFGGVDRLVFKGDLTPEHLVFRREKDDLVIRIIDSDDQITILNWFTRDWEKLDLIQFANGSEMSPSHIEELLQKEENSGGCR